MRRVLLSAAAGWLLTVSPSAATSTTGEALHFQAAGTLAITEVSPVKRPGGAPWFELQNRSAEALVLGGAVIVTDTDRHFELPATTPPLAPGGFAIVQLGKGAPPRHDLGKPSVMIVPAPESLATAWTPSSGRLAVLLPPAPGLAPSKVADAVAWGDPGDRSGGPGAGPWKHAPLVPLWEGFGLRPANARLAPGASIGLLPGHPGGRPGDWGWYDPAETTPGAPNLDQRPKVFTLADGAQVGPYSVSVGWPGRDAAMRYRFQLAPSPGVKEPIVDALIDTTAVRVEGPLPEGTYAFRVRAVSAEGKSLWSQARTVKVVSTPCDLPWWPATGAGRGAAVARDPWSGTSDASTLRCSLVRQIEPKLQRKDTHLVCLHAGCPRPSAGCADCGWDHPHAACVSVCRPAGGTCVKLCAGAQLSATCGQAPCGQTPVTAGCEHGSQSCVRASISMMASAYGTCLSQDRIAFQVAESSWSLPPQGWIPPKWELGHALPMDCQGMDGGDCTAALQWALSIQPQFSQATPGFPALMQWVDAGRPIMSQATDPAGNSHMRVLAGYCRDRGPRGAWVLIYDPLTGPRVESYASWSATSDGTWVGPPVSSKAASSVRRDEPEVWSDTDQDGLMDFDEIRRFFTSFQLADSDGDGVPDKNEDLATLTRGPLTPVPPPAPTPVPVPSP